MPLLIEYALRYRAVRHADLTLVLAGDGPVTVPADTSGVRDLGYLDLAAKTAAYAAAAVVCQPSVDESFSIVLMEAWLAGTPVLVHARCPVTTHHVFQSGGGLAFDGFTSSRKRWTSSSRTARDGNGSDAGPRLH